MTITYRPAGGETGIEDECFLDIPDWALESFIGFMQWCRRNLGGWHAGQRKGNSLVALIKGKWWPIMTETQFNCFIQLKNDADGENIVIDIIDPAKHVVVMDNTKPRPVPGGNSNWVSSEQTLISDQSNAIRADEDSLFTNDAHSPQPAKRPVELRSLVSCLLTEASCKSIYPKKY